jgi:DNA-binding transcriptional MerR regulator
MLKAKKNRPADFVPESETFSSLDVTRMTGVSLRQLQWWDEQGVVTPQQRGHKRLYQLHEVIEVSVITELRRKGISLQKIRRVLRYLHKEFGKGLYDSVRNGSEVHLLTDGQNIYLEDSHSNIVDILKNARQPLISVCLSDQVQQLNSAAPPRKASRSETRVAQAQVRAAASKTS